LRGDRGDRFDRGGRIDKFDRGDRVDRGRGDEVAGDNKKAHRGGWAFLFDADDY
jgi:hypothetical protein